MSYSKALDKSINSETALWTSLVVQWGKNPLANVGNMGLIPAPEDARYRRAAKPTGLGHSY